MDCWKAEFHNVRTKELYLVKGRNSLAQKDSLKYTKSLFLVIIDKGQKSIVRERYCAQTSQELRMLSSVTLNCQATKIVKQSSSQLSEM